MRIAIAGGHGQVARHLSRALTARGDVPVALVRQLQHVGDVVADGAEAVVLDLERANARDVAEAIAGADAVVFAAVSKNNRPVRQCGVYNLRRAHRLFGQ